MSTQVFIRIVTPWHSLSCLYIFLDIPQILVDASYSWLPEERSSLSWSIAQRTQIKISWITTSEKLWKYSFLEWVHSEMKIFNKINLHPIIVPFAFNFFKSVTNSSDIYSCWKFVYIVTLLLRICIFTPRACIYCFQELHDPFQDLYYCFKNIQII